MSAIGPRVQLGSRATPPKTKGFLFAKPMDVAAVEDLLASLAEQSEAAA